MRVALIHECDRPWLCEVEVVVLDYPIIMKAMNENDEGKNIQTSTSVDTDEEFGTWCEDNGYFYEIVIPRNHQ